MDPVPDAIFDDQCLIPVDMITHFLEYPTTLETSDFDFLFVLDRSSSMLFNDPNDYTRLAAINLMNRLPAEKNVAAGVVIFGGGQLIRPLTTDRSAILQTLNSLPPRTLGTDIAGAILVADQEFRTNGRPEFAKFMILVSDGESYTSEALKVADEAGLPIHTFFIGDPNRHGNALMQDIAERTGGNYYHVTNPNNLPYLFESAINTYIAKVSRVELTSDYAPETMFRAYRTKTGWSADRIPIFGPTTIMATAWTNEVPPRSGSDSVYVIAYTGKRTTPYVEIREPQMREIRQGPEIPVRGESDVFWNPGVLGPPDDPCLLTDVKSVDIHTIAVPNQLFPVQTDPSGNWVHENIPIRIGPRQRTILTAVGHTNDYLPKSTEVTVEVAAGIPCRPLAENLDRIYEPDWEWLTGIGPFDAPTRMTVDSGTFFSLSGSVTNGFFGIYQTRLGLCPPPGGANVLRVHLAHQRNESAPLPDCRVRVFNADNTRSYFCRVNEVTGQLLPSSLEVPFLSDGDDEMRLAIDLLAFDPRNDGGWIFQPPLEFESDWTYPIHAPLTSVAAATFLAELPEDRSGSALASIGDVNQDGFDDFLIAARAASKAQTAAGQVYLIPGSANGWGRWVDLWEHSHSFLGEGPEDSAGYSLSGAGDVNGDGYDDFLIGAPGNNQAGDRAGKTYLFFGRDALWGAERPIDEADAAFVGEAPGDRSGTAVAGVGDVNGDGYDDFLIGAPNHSNGLDEAGKVYLFFGQPSGWTKNLSVADADATFLGEAAYDRAGTSLAAAGDVEGDGYADFLIGAPDRDVPADRAGTVYLVLGRDRGWVNDFPLAGATYAFNGEAQNDRCGISLASAGDVNGDGLDDFLIGAPYNARYGTESGAAYLLLGKTTGWLFGFSVANADAVFLGDVPMTRAGHSVSGAGDVNGDGIDDFLIGSVFANEGNPSAGAACLVFGSRDGIPAEMRIESAPIVFHGDHAGSWAGYRVRGVGDVNGDGLDDMAITAPTDSIAGLDAGHTYLILGNPSVPYLAALDESSQLARLGSHTTRTELSTVRRDFTHPYLEPAHSIQDSTPRHTNTLAQPPALSAALADLNGTSWEPWPQILPFQASTLTDTEEGIRFDINTDPPKQFFAFYQSRESFPPLPPGLHVLRLHIQHHREPGFLVPDVRCRVFHADNSIAYFTLCTEIPGGILPTVVDVPFLSDGVSPFRIAFDLLAFDSRMLGGWSVTNAELLF